MALQRGAVAVVGGNGGLERDLPHLISEVHARLERGDGLVESRLVGPWV